MPVFEVEDGRAVCCADRGRVFLKRESHQPPLPDISCVERVMVLHRFRNGGRYVGLYLPEGQQPTEEHGRLLDEALRRA